MRIKLKPRHATGMVCVGVLALLGTYAIQAGDQEDRPDRIGAGVCYNKLPTEAHDTLNDIMHGGPYQFPKKDGTVFENRDDNPLPRHENGYYHEFTVVTPGLDHRGARRIVTGGKIPDRIEDYYTADHYRTFDLIDYDC